MRLQGKSALITAAGQGIGRACALSMAAEGALVWATDVNPKSLECFEGVQNIFTMSLNVLDKSSILRAIAAIPAIDVLFNCAGHVHTGSIESSTDKDWDFAVDLNIRSQFWMIQAALPKLLTSRKASIINIGSVSSLKGMPSRFLYCTTKAAVIGLTKSVAADYVTQGVRCNAICPGTVMTPSYDERVSASPDPSDAHRMYVAAHPMRRLAEPSEIAPLVVFLASDESSFVTGQAFAIDGGLTTLSVGSSASRP